ncbi:MAG: methyltransferase [Deltaproteobacteria bacterium]|nr:methyltransferase [Deltaproteobacteria bacterium]
MSPFDKQDILNILDQSGFKMTPGNFIKKIKSKALITTFEAKNILNQLINEQELSYHYLYGSTYIEKSFLKPVRITKNFILKPPGYQRQPGKNDIEMMIGQGISFGSGRHPTTRLCLKALDFCFFDSGMLKLRKDLKGADIGTGSGVLAMAMCLSGLASCRAYEIDPVSMNEARKNVALNRLEKKIDLVEDFMKESKNTFSIICANLRFPTLKALSCTIYKSLTKNGIAVLSGVRAWEKENLVSSYSKTGFDLAWQKDEKKWSAFVLEKKT